MQFYSEVAQPHCGVEISGQKSIDYNTCRKKILITFYFCEIKSEDYERIVPTLNI